jgi:hypothetical protein
MAIAGSPMRARSRGARQVSLGIIGDRRETHDPPLLLRQDVAGEVVPWVMPPEGRLSCRRCMISTIAPRNLSLSRL